MCNEPALAVPLAVEYSTLTLGGKLPGFIPGGTVWTSVENWTVTAVLPSTPVKVGSLKPTRTAVPSAREHAELSPKPQNGESLWTKYREFNQHREGDN
jgi:hypothetical protein